MTYTGKDTDPNTIGRIDPESGMGTKVALELLEPLLGKGYCLRIDNFYTSPELVDIQLNNCTDVYRTVHANRKGMPPEFCAPKLKNRKMLSSVHSATMEEFKNTKAREVVKLSIARDYNHTMGGVDKSDQMLAIYLVPRKR